jgi:hypothetical protein
MARSAKLGKVEKPAAEEFSKGKKLFFLPLVFTPEKAAPDFKEIADRYWQQAAEQIESLEEKLSPVKKIYHEWIAETGEKGLKAVEKIDAGSREIVKGLAGKGTEILALEDKELTDEFIDWGRCLSIGLISQKALSEVYRFYAEAQKKRQEHILKKIEETLGTDEVGLLVMREGHQMQFPGDIQIFYVAPPALDEIRRWLRDNEAKPKK